MNDENEVKEIAKRLGKRGGEKTKEKHGKEYYKRIGKLGGRPKKSN